MRKLLLPLLVCLAIAPVLAQEYYSDIEVTHYTSEGFETQEKINNGTSYLLVGGGTKSLVYHRPVTVPAPLLQYETQGATTTLSISLSQPAACVPYENYYVSMEVDDCDIWCTPDCVCWVCGDADPPQGTLPTGTLEIGP